MSSPDGQPTSLLGLPQQFKSHSALLETPVEEIFDRYSALASKMLGAPIALVSLVEENRQWFQGQHGLSEPLATLRETPLSHSICKYVVANRAPIVIADTSSNSLTAGSLAVTELGVGAYAGVPLVTSEGETIGSFCAIDREPRAWTDRDMELLSDLAQMVMREIDLSRVAQDLRSQADRVQKILESLTDAFGQLDNDWRITFLNEQAEHLLRCPREDLLGQNVWEAFPESIGTTFEQEFRKASETGQPFFFEEFYEPFQAWFGVHVYPGEDGLAVYFQDITTRKNVEKRLHLLESVVVHTNDTVIITEASPIHDPGPRIIYVNEAFTRMTGYSAEEAMGRSPRFLQGPKTDRFFLNEIRRGLEQLEPTNVELINYRKNGQEFWTEMSIVPVVNALGEVTHFTSIQRDITQRKLDREVLQLARNEAERANLAKNEFLSRMSHELRTPLNAILGFGQLLEMTELNERETECVEQIMRGGQHLLTLINEVLDIARIEAGQISLSLEPVEAGPVCQEVLALVKVMGNQNSISLKHDKPTCPVIVMADQQRLKQILLNLLSNAIKYNRPGGSVTMTCQVVEGERMRFEVRDEGIGIPLGKRDRVFAPFDRLDVERRSPGQTPVEGTGIGLALSQRLAHAMGGTLDFKSTEGVGSTFYLELPLAEATSINASPDHGQDSTDSPPAPTDTEIKQQILYIEDNLSNLRLIERLLEQRPLKVLSTQQGQLGIDLARDQHPDLILLDLNLPDMSGEEVLQKLLDHPLTYDIPVVMLSADASPRQITQLLNAGAKAYLTKPINVREFFHTIDQMLEPSVL